MRLISRYKVSSHLSYRLNKPPHIEQVNVPIYFVYFIGACCEVILFIALLSWHFVAYHTYSFVHQTFVHQTGVTQVTQRLLY